MIKLHKKLCKEVLVIAVKDGDRINDRRVTGDRRKRPTPLLCRQAVSGGLRKNVRRKEDKKKHIFVDTYGLRLFITLLLLLTLSITDAYLTLILVKAFNAAEVNPTMAFYLRHGSITFFLVKILFTSVAVFIFCVFNCFAVARISLALAIIIYAGVVYYELSILSNFFP
jgi:Domain of unknown function (DUF5658)